LKLPVSSLFDYVDDPNDEDSTLAWFIYANDEVTTEIIEDTINFSAPADWFGSDSIHSML